MRRGRTRDIGATRDINVQGMLLYIRPHDGRIASKAGTQALPSIHLSLLTGVTDERYKKHRSGQRDDKAR